MKKILFFLQIILLFSYSLKGNSQIIWEEKGYKSIESLKQGIPAFGQEVIYYKREGKTILTVKLDEPVVIDVAKKPEKRGYFQFPGINKTNDGVLVATWHMAEDAVTSYGQIGGSKSVVSYDDGKTWCEIYNTIPSVGGIELPNGDKIKVHTPKAIDRKELNLPDSLAAVKENYGRTFVYYKMTELPQELQGVYLSRLKKGENTWKIEKAILNDQSAVRYIDSGWFPVVWWGDLQIAPDGSILAGIYPGLYLDENNKVSPSGVIFYRSADNGKSWNYQGKIPYQPDLETDPNGTKRIALGYTEPASILLKNGVYLCVMRTTDGLGNSPMYVSQSTDMGVSWTKPKTFTKSGVLPKLLQLENGSIVLASGRPGIQLRFAIDEKGETWTDPIEMLPFENIEGEVSCGYPDIVQAGPNSFQLIYSDFKYLNEKGEIRKAIKIRKVEVLISK